MIASACREYIRKLFSDLYPGCTVIYSYPGISPRPPLPYIVLDFGKVQTSKVNAAIEDGILQQAWYKTIPFTAELVASSKVTHSDGSMSVSASTVVDDLDRSIQFLRSDYVADQSRAVNIAISVAGDPEPVYNAAPSVERAKCSYSVDFIESTDEYAALHPADGVYSADHPSAASEKLTNMRAGWFNEAEIIPKVNE